MRGLRRPTATVFVQVRRRFHVARVLSSEDFEQLDWSRLVDPDSTFTHKYSTSVPVNLRERSSPRRIWYSMRMRAREHLPTALVRLRNPDPVDFYVNYVSKNIPVILEGVLDSSFARKHWNEAYLKAMLQDKEVLVSSSPSGVFDEVVMSEVGKLSAPTLARPRLKHMKYDDFSDLVHSGKDFRAVHAVKPFSESESGELESNFLTDFKQLRTDVPVSLDVAKHLTDGCRNLSIHQAGATDSFRANFQENFDCLLLGTRKWVLLPPTDLPFLYFNYYMEGHYDLYEPPPEDRLKEKCQAEQGTIETSPQQWTILRALESEDDDKVPWIEADPTESHPLHPRASNCNPIHYTQQPGETLFIPATWHYKVSTLADPSFSVSYGYAAHNPAILTNYFLMVQFDKHCRQQERAPELSSSRS